MQDLDLHHLDPLHLLHILPLLYTLFCDFNYDVRSIESPSDSISTSRYGAVNTTNHKLHFTLAAFAKMFKDAALSAMGGSSSSTFVSFLGALQASLAVLLTISYGVIASRWKLLSDSSARDISKTCVRLFLPALLITNIGSELDVSTVGRYVPVLSKLLFP